MKRASFILFTAALGIFPLLVPVYVLIDIIFIVRGVR